jgi:cell division protein FtsW (lipid II flippase)
MAAVMQRPQAVPSRSLPVATGPLAGYDLWLVSVCLFLLVLGLVMLTSASVTIAERQFSDPSTISGVRGQRQCSVWHWPGWPCDCR